MRVARRAAVALLSAWAAAAAGADPATLARVKSVLDARCVACHSCYNAPCQLDLGSWEGLARGASSERVYDGTRLAPVAPTRLFVDAPDAAAWHAHKGFFPVTRPLGGDSPAFSVMGRMLALKRAYPGRRVTAKHGWMCPSTRAGLGVYASLGRDGMPKGFPGLADADYALLMTWLDSGAAMPAPAPAPIPASLRAQMDAWEAFLNRDDARHRIVARYLYEHLFLAHLHFEGHGSRFFRLVRSRTPSPQAVDEIATVRPYDDPGVEGFRYRFREVAGTLVHKTHITFPLGPGRLARYRDWFLGEAWPDRDPEVPGYEPRTSANPFETFQAIPALARYRLFLDNARYFVMTFIRGPVCEGQMAVNVINDHFQVLFLDPAFDLSVTDPGFLEGAAGLLELPVAGRSDPFETYYLSYKKRQRRYTAYREERYARAFPDGVGMEAVWDGAGEDPDAMLTVFRHFDNAAVVHGPRGGEPKTAWVMDYPIFERIYYLLVAGFNVYGNAFHQASTRLYMDNLRVESEDLFLSFLPRGARRALRDGWYRGMLAGLKMESLNPLRGVERPSAVRLRDGDPKAAFLDQAVARLGAAAAKPEPLLNVAPGPRAAAFAPSAEGVERALNRLTGRPAPFVPVMPDLTYLIVEFDARRELYALIRNKAHSNVAFLLNEDDRRLPEEDTLVILKGVAGSYPNLIARVAAADVGRLVALLEGWTGDAQANEALFRRFGVSRHRADFWLHYDALNALAARQEGVGAARMDLSKYDFR